MSYINTYSLQEALQVQQQTLIDVINQISSALVYLEPRIAQLELELKTERQRIEILEQKISNSLPYKEHKVPTELDLVVENITEKRLVEISEKMGKMFS